MTLESLQQALVYAGKQQGLEHHFCRLHIAVL